LKDANKKSDSSGNLIRFIGPGFITAALVLGPGSLTVTSKLGAVYEYQLLWLVLLSTIFMITFTVMAAKFGLKSDRTLISAIREEYGKTASITTGVGVFLVTASFQSGNAIGAGLAFAGLFHTDPWYWIIVFNLMAIALLFFRSFYKILEKIMILLVGIMLLSFLFTLVLSKPSLTDVLSGVIPSIPTGSELLSIALVATGFSVVGAFYQSYLVQEKGWRQQDLTHCNREAISGIIILGVISSMVLLTAGSVLFGRGIMISSAADMGKALEPLFGQKAFMVFMIGLFAASFSSLVGNATLGGSILADTLGLGRNLQTTGTRWMITAVILTGAIVALVFRHLQLQLIILAQGFTVLFAPFIGLVIYGITNNGSIMKNMKNSNTLKVMGSLGLVALLIVAFGYIYMLLN
jgi:Mn2+/Fe2+ NRAMP family transporter